MGQKLSCVSKTTETDKERGKLSHKKKGKAVDNAKEGDVVVEKVETVVAAAQNSAAPVDSEKPKQRVILMEPAPSGFSPPKPAAVLQQRGGQQPEVGADSMRDASSAKADVGKPHADQPVDTAARHLAQNPAKAVCWRDLYWHLIGSRDLKTEEEKVRALFTWLCSRPPRQNPFAVQEDLEQAADDGNEKHGKKTKLPKLEKPAPDSPEAILPNLAKEQATYFQAFECLCRNSGISCVTVSGIAKGVEYKVGQELVTAGEPPINSQTGALQPQLASVQHAWNAACVDGTWQLFDCTWAARRLAMTTGVASARASQASHAATLQYETDMFYFEIDPAKLIYTHYPFNDVWQLLTPTVSAPQFASWPLVKPAFFRYGLSAYSHPEGFINVTSNLVLKLRMLPENVGKLLFTYSLNLEGLGDIYKGSNLTCFGMHEIVPSESAAVFTFRLPKKGTYKLLLYVRRSGEQLFSDVCEYRVDAKGVDETTLMPALAYPPTTQSSYGPTEKAAELGLETLPRQLSSCLKAKNGVLEVRFISAEPAGLLPRLTARLKSITVKATELENCTIIRDIEASMPTTGTSVLTGSGPCVPMSIVNAYLPMAGEYALEVYAAPADSEETTSYYLAWQFLIDADVGHQLSSELRGHLATINMGPLDSTWKQLGFRNLSHPDPLVRIRTTARSGHVGNKVMSASELLQKFASTHATENDGENQQEEMSIKPVEQPINSEGDIVDDHVDSMAADLKIIFGLPEPDKVCLLAQLVGISAAKETDYPGHIVMKTEQQMSQEEEFLSDLNVNRLSSSISVEPSQRIYYLVRIPKGGQFYKLYFYATMITDEVTDPIPLVYTYLIEAPLRLTSAEAPYIGAIHGEFPEKIEQRKAAAEEPQ